MTGRLVVKGGRFYVVISYQDSQGKNKQKWKATGLPVKNNKRIAEELMRDIVANFDPKWQKCSIMHAFSCHYTQSIGDCI